MQGAPIIRPAGVAAMALLLSACAGGGDFRPVRDTPVRIGKPYTVRGATYVPAAAPAYDAIGYASWYGSERSEEHTSELQSLMRISYAVFCLKKKKRLTRRLEIDATQNRREHV